MKSTWDRMKIANLWHGRVVDLAAFAQCIDAPNLEFEDLLLSSRELLIFCQKGLGGKKKLQKRSIGLASYFLGEGDSILSLQSSLHNTIKGYNSNFKNMKHFDEQLVANLNNMANDVEKIAVTENNMIEGFLQIRQDLRHMKQFFSFLILKQQHIDALAGILETSNIEKNLILLQRGLVKNNICDFNQCETFIHSQREGAIITVYQELLTLIPRDQWVISCKLKSATHVSTWHNTLAARSGVDSLILNNQIVKASDLRNESVVNQEL